MYFWAGLLTKDQLFPCLKSSVKVSVSSHLSHLWLFTQLLTPSVRLFLSPLSHPGLCATREWRWAHGRGVCTVVFIVLWSTPLKYGISLSVHWWLTESGVYTDKDAIFLLAELLELENASVLNRWDAERLIPLVLCSLWGPRKNVWDNSIHITMPHCTQG